MEFGEILLVHCTDTWYRDLEGQVKLALLEFSTFNKKKVLFSAHITDLPRHLKKYAHLMVQPKNIILV